MNNEMKKLSFLLFVFIGSQIIAFSQCYVADFPTERGYYSVVDSILSGHFTMITKRNIYFKDFGKSIAVIIFSDGKPKHILYTGGKCYQLDYHNKIYLAHPHLLGQQLGQMDELTSFTIDTIKYSGWKHMGEKLVAGKNCKVYLQKEKNGETKVWIWENIIFKKIRLLEQEESILGKSVHKLEIISFNDSIHKITGLFEIPKGFKHWKNRE